MTSTRSRRMPDLQPTGTIIYKCDDQGGGSGGPAEGTPRFPDCEDRAGRQVHVPGAGQRHELQPGVLHRRLAGGGGRCWSGTHAAETASQHLCLHVTCYLCIWNPSPRHKLLYCWVEHVILASSLSLQCADALRLAVSDALCRNAERRSHFKEAMFELEAEDTLGG